MNDMLKKHPVLVRQRQKIGKIRKEIASFPYELAKLKLQEIDMRIEAMKPRNIGKPGTGLVHKRIRQIKERVKFLNERLPIEENVLKGHEETIKKHMKYDIPQGLKLFEKKLQVAKELFKYVQRVKSLTKELEKTQMDLHYITQETGISYEPNLGNYIWSLLPDVSDYDKDSLKEMEQRLEQMKKDITKFYPNKSKINVILEIIDIR